MSIDHKPNNLKENRRIIKSGGSIYQSQSQNQNYGPFRILPGRLSVSRAFGDIEAKHSSLGGNPRVLIATPEIKCFEINSEYDFLVMGSDGIYEKQSNEEIIKTIWNWISQNSLNSNKTLHEMIGEAADVILK